MLKSFIIILSIVNFNVSVYADEVPDGWKKWGAEYEAGVDNKIYYSAPKSYFVNSNANATDKTVGEVNTQTDEKIYRGKRIKLSANLRVSKEVTGRTAGAAIYIQMYDSSGSKMIMGGFDCYTWDKPNNWRNCSVVLDVPENTKILYYAYKIFGKGQVWADDISLDIVSNEVPIKGIYNKFK